MEIVMKKTNLVVLLLSFGLTACSSNSFNLENPFSSSTKMTEKTERVAANGVIGGNVASRMDENDKSKLFHALDNPVGKSTQWMNANTKINYTVVPTKKVVLNGNPFCREYTIVAKYDNGVEQHVSGKACVGADSNWQAV